MQCVGVDLNVENDVITALFVDRRVAMTWLMMNELMLLHFISAIYKFQMYQGAMVAHK